jgi:hypothetical protein
LNDHDIFQIDIPASKLEVEKMTAKALIELLNSKKIKFKTVSIVDQMVEEGERLGIIELPPQVVPYVVEFTPAMLERFLELYRRIVKELSGQSLINDD